MSNKKTSTAALDSFRHGTLPSSVAFRATRPAQKKPGRVTNPSFQPYQQAGLAIYKETIMNSITPQVPGRNLAMIFAVMLRVTCALLLWTLGASAMDIRLSQVPSKEQRIVHNFPIDRVAMENLQRWVNAGHDPWCRDPQLVAAAALRRVSPGFSDYELAAVPLEVELSQKTMAIYIFHSPDGRTSYRITLRRYPFLLPTAGSFRQMIWVPESAEIPTRDVQD